MEIITVEDILQYASYVMGFIEPLFWIVIGLNIAMILTRILKLEQFFRKDPLLEHELAEYIPPPPRYRAPRGRTLKIIRKMHRINR